MEEVPIRDKSDIFSLLEMGESHRSYGVTNMNERSSRSHTIFRLTVESSSIVRSSSDDGSVGGQDGTAITASQLNLVDLAGSERVGQTGAAGERLKEGANINNSLMVLGQVISKLSEASSEHIPYRNSKLTRILKASLGGNSRTAIVCTVTPLESGQTKSTLEFASRAKKIVQHAQKNEILDNVAGVERMKSQIAELKAALAEQQQKKEKEKDFAEERITILRKLAEQFLNKPSPMKAVTGASGFPAEAKRRQSWHPSMMSLPRQKS